MAGSSVLVCAVRFSLDRWMCLEKIYILKKVFLLNRWMETCPFVPRRAGAADQGWQQEMVDMAETGHEAKVLGLIHSICGEVGGC